MRGIFRQEPGFYGRMIRLAIPMVIQNVITNSMGLLDTFMVGMMGEEPLAGVTLANIPVFVINLMMFGIQSGSAVLISQYRGKGDNDTINRIMGMGMYAAGAVTLLFALIMGCLPGPFMSLFGSDPAVIGVAARYARIVGWSYLFDSVVQVYIGAHRAMGSPQRGMYILALSMVCNTVLNWMLIFGTLGIPAMGVEGAALATLLARILAFVIVLVWAIRDRDFRIRPALLFCPGRTAVLKFLRFATPVLCNETMWGLGTSLFPTIMGHMDGSREILAAYAIAGNITNLCSVGIFALANAASILIGQEIGGGRMDRVYRLGGLLDVLAFLFGLGLGVVCMGLLHWVVIPLLYPMFRLSETAASICTMMLTVVFASMSLRGFNTTSIVGVLRGGGDVAVSTAIDLIPLWLVALPLAALSGLVWELGILWVYLSMAAENLVKCGLGIARYRSGKWMRDVTLPREGQG